VERGNFNASLEINITKEWEKCLSLTRLTWSRSTFEYTMATASNAMNVINPIIHGTTRPAFSCWHDQMAAARKKAHRGQAK
jgi:hypothetical protein